METISFRDKIWLQKISHKEKISLKEKISFKEKIMLKV